MNAYATALRIPAIPRCSISKSFDARPIEELVPIAGRTSPHGARAHCSRLALGSMPAARGWRLVWVRRSSIRAVPSVPARPG
jgi:hypothetical protein